MSADSDLASRLLGIATGYLPAHILFAAVELRLFDALDVPRTLEEITARTGGTPNGIFRLCAALGTMGLVSVEGGRVAASPEAFLALRSEGSVAPIILHHQRQVAPLFAGLGAAARTGLAQHARWQFARSPVAETSYAELARHPEEIDRFLAAMERSSAGVGTAIARDLHDLGVRRIVDLGCGGGVVAREILTEMPDAVVLSFDLDRMADIARKRSALAGLASRHIVATGDIVAGVGARDADAVLLSAVLADFDDDERRHILEGARTNLKPGGWLVISETLLDEDRLGPPDAVMLSLVMLVAMRGDQLSADELTSLLEASGFSEIRIRRGAPRDLIVARASTS
ncbi:MAG: methyltransferase domain-containing protein [Polyangiaceae bacterium]|nr:methyltransferase domain-containing protein [Polyangiaceae bacterium]